MASTTPEEEICRVIDDRVSIAMANTYRLELSTVATPVSIADRQTILQVLFHEIIAAIGIDRFMGIPVETLDQFAVMSVVKDHDTGGMLLSLVNSFMIAYSLPETSDAAFESLLAMEGVRDAAALVLGTGNRGSAVLH